MFMEIVERHFHSDSMWKLSESYSHFIVRRNTKPSAKILVSLMSYLVSKFFL